MTRRISQALEASGSWVPYLALLLIAFIPRVMAVGAYVTVDEQRWIERAVDFVYNLTHGDLAPIVSIHPGVTGTWGFGSFLFLRFLLSGDLSALYQMGADGYYDLPNLLPTAALFTALLTSCTVLAGYFFLKKLLGGRIAFLAALLIAVDPNYLAHSRRVHLDAILASTMFLSALALLAYTCRPRTTSSLRHLLVSGFLAGLAWLTKLTALYLVPFALLALAAQWITSSGGLHFNRSAPWRQLGAFLLWSAVACVTFFVLWPSMWVGPSEVLGQLAHTFSWGLDAPHTMAQGPDATPMQFFMGRVVEDPGPGYYPLISIFRLSPITLLFLPVGVAAITVRAGRRALGQPRVLAAWLGVAYVVFFVAMISLADKKLESYALPIFPMLDVLAAIGLMAVVYWLARPRPQVQSHGAQPFTLPLLYALTVTGIIATSFLWLRLKPYYSAYFNPLAGGASVASRLFVFGGGEGLDMAARYLNQKQDAGQLTVATGYPDHVFRYYFEGTTWPLRQGDWTGLWLLADYVVSYFSYAQRELPSPGVIDFFDTLEPEYVARIGGVDYARVYRVPSLVVDELPPISHPAQVNLADEVTFLGYDLETERVASGGPIEITLYWQGRQPIQKDYSVYLHLVNGVNHVWGSQDSAPLYGAMPTSLWEEGMIVADRHRFHVWPGTPPGVYQIAVGMYDSATMRHLEPVGLEVPLQLGPVEVVRGMAGGLPSPQHRLEANLDSQVRLVGYDLPGQAQPGHPLHLTLYWESLSPMNQDYTVFVHLVSGDGKLWGQQDSQPVTGFYPTSLWTEGEFVRDQYDLIIPEETPPGQYTLQVGMYELATGRRLPLRDERGQVAGDYVSLASIQVDRP